MAAAAGVDVRQVRRNFARAAAGYDAVAVLQREVGRRMLERLDYVKIEPRRILDLGCGTGGELAALGERYGQAQLLGADFSEPMLRAGRGTLSRLRFLLPFRRKPAQLVAADAAALPLASASLGLVWSNQLLHWLADPLPVFREALRTLEVGGLFMFATLGPDTLKELRACFTDDDAHTQFFTDLHDYGDMLVDSGFADPVMDVERVTLTYPSAAALVRDLKRNGAGCAMRDRRRGLMGRDAWDAALARYAGRVDDGRLAASFEVVYGHAWKAEPRQTADGRAIVRFAPRPPR